MNLIHICVEIHKNIVSPNIIMVLRVIIRRCTCKMIFRCIDRCVRLYSTNNKISCGKSSLVSIVAIDTIPGR